jgi:hypothetical protein
LAFKLCPKTLGKRRKTAPGFSVFSSAISLKISLARPLGEWPETKSTYEDDAGSMNEDEFISMVDCAFPYEDEAEARRLIALAPAISSNACFMVAEELSRPPGGARATSEVRLGLLHQLRSAFDHPLREAVLAVAEKAILGGNIDLPAARALLGQVRLYPNQFCAMNVVYFACSYMESDNLDDECEQIREQWGSPL